MDTFFVNDIMTKFTIANAEKMQKEIFLYLESHIKPKKEANK